MLRIVFSADKKQHVNMKSLREKIRMMSVNQMNVYHTLLEAYNIIHNSSSEVIKMKWENKNESKYFLRSDLKFDQKIPEKPMTKCIGFSYHGSKLFNKLPCSVKESENKSSFKSLIKTWIWKNIPSY